MAKWRDEQLGNLVSFEYGSALRAESRTGHGFNVYGSNGVVGHHDSSLVAGPGIIIGRKGSVGALHWSEDDFWPIDTTYWAKPKADLDLRWIREALALAGLESLDSSTGVPGLNRYDAYERWVPVPPLEEQRQIAEILDTIDETIQATERVIAKRKMIRAGLATSLLSGGAATEDWELNKTQPPPGSTSTSWTWVMADWRERRLGDIGKVVGGGTPSRERAEYWAGDIRWLTPAELTGISQKYVSETKDCITELGLATSGARLLPQGSLLVTSRASIGSCALAGVPMATNQGFKNLVPSAEVDPSFLFYLGRTLGREMTRRASGTTFLEISGREFGRITVSLPPLEEQRRIAKILDTIDETIRANERKRDKLRHLRSGLAADLLSGRVRTVAA